MAYSTAGYQTVYGIGLLDDLHNFFPEIMYDDAIFPSEHVSWFRSRISTLFPSFTRQESMYRIYHAANRLNEYNSWRNDRNVPLPVNPNFTTIPPVIPQTFQTPLRQTAGPVRTPNAPRRVQRTTGLATSMLFPNEPVFDLMELMIEATTGGNQNRTVIMPGLFQDIPIVPTNQQIEAGSHIVQARDIPSDERCVVCQEHGSEAEEWRSLHCSHTFHDRCILNWFHRDSHCPVCRADVREP